jgi:hypothetical protein
MPDFLNQFYKELTKQIIADRPVAAQPIKITVNPRAVSIYEPRKTLRLTPLTAGYQTFQFLLTGFIHTSITL